MVCPDVQSMPFNPKFPIVLALLLFFCLTVCCDNLGLEPKNITRFVRALMEGRNYLLPVDSDEFTEFLGCVFYRQPPLPRWALAIGLRDRVPHYPFFETGRSEPAVIHLMSSVFWRVFCLVFMLCLVLAQTLPLVMTSFFPALRRAFYSGRIV